MVEQLIYKEAFELFKDLGWRMIGVSKRDPEVYSLRHHKHPWLGATLKQNQHKTP